MIRLYLFSLLAIVLALVVTLYLGFPTDPGYILIAFGNVTFETSLFALFGVLVVAVLVYIAAKALFLVLRWVNPLRLWVAGLELNSQRKAQALDNNTAGLLALARGNPQAGLNSLQKAMREQDATAVTSLAAAYAACQLGQRDTWLEILEAAEQKYPAAQSSASQTIHHSINHVKAQLYFRSGQFEQSLAVLEELKKNPSHGGELSGLLAELYVQLDDWEHLAELLPTLQREKLLPGAELERIEQKIFRDKLEACRDAAKAGDENEVFEMKTQWKKAPTACRENPRLVAHYVGLLLELEQQQDAAKTIETALDTNWDSGLVNLYGNHDYGCSAGQLAKAENWLRHKPDDAGLLLSLGRISMRNRLWGKAREYYEASIKNAPSAEAYGELGRLLQSLGEPEASEDCWENYRQLTGSVLPELPMPSPEQLNRQSSSNRAKE